MAEATVSSKVVDSLLLIYCLMHFPLFVGNLCLSLFCYVLLCVHSIFCNHLEEEEKAGCFAFIVLQMSCYCKCLWLFLTVSWVGLQCIIVIFPDITHLFFACQIHMLQFYHPRPL